MYKRQVHGGIGQHITLGQVIRKADHGPILLGIVEKFPPPGGDGGGLQIEDADDVTVIQDIVPADVYKRQTIVYSLTTMERDMKNDQHLRETVSDIIKNGKA